MLIFNTTDGDVNSIHLVIGPQTDLQFDMVGFLRLDISEMLERYPDKSLPLTLLMTRSENEFVTMQKLKLMGHSSINEIIDDEDDDDDDDESPDQSEQSINQTESTKSKDPRGTYNKNYRCPMCRELGVFLKKDKMVLCGDCMKIELGLGKTAVSENKKDESKDKE